MKERRIPFAISLPRSKGDWLDARATAERRRPSDVVEELVDEAMERDAGAKRNGAHKDQAKRA